MCRRAKPWAPPLVCARPCGCVYDACSMCGICVFRMHGVYSMLGVCGVRYVACSVYCLVFGVQ